MLVITSQVVFVTGNWCQNPSYLLHAFSSTFFLPPSYNIIFMAAGSLGSRISKKLSSEQQTTLLYVFF